MKMRDSLAGMKGEGSELERSDFEELNTYRRVDI